MNREYMAGIISLKCWLLVDTHFSTVQTTLRTPRTHKLKVLEKKKKVSGRNRPIRVLPTLEQSLA